MLGGFLSDIRNGVSAADAEQRRRRVLDTVLDIAVQNLVAVRDRTLPPTHHDMSTTIRFGMGDPPGPVLRLKPSPTPPHKREGLRRSTALLPGNVEDPLSCSKCHQLGGRQSSLLVDDSNRPAVMMTAIDPQRTGRALRRFVFTPVIDGPLGR